MIKFSANMLASTIRLSAISKAPATVEIEYSRMNRFRSNEEAMGYMRSEFKSRGLDIENYEFVQNVPGGGMITAVFRRKAA